MFDFFLGTSEPESTSLDPSLVSRTSERVARWLAEGPTADDLFRHLPALEFALALYVKNHNEELLRLAVAAIERMNTDPGLEALSNETLAELVLFNLRAAQCVGRLATQVAATGPWLGVATRVAATGARDAIAVANRRWDKEGNYFKPNATDTSGVLNVRANAKLGEAFYFAWRALDDQDLRPTAGDILGQVSTAFDEKAALYARDDVPVMDGNEIRRIGTIAAAMDLFLTASETTGRGTYMPRAIIAANFAPEDTEIERAPLADRIAFAKALLRLEQSTGEPGYGRRARILLKNATAGLVPGIETADAALAVEVATSFPLHIAILGDVENDETARGLWFAAMRVYAPVRAIEALDPIRHARRLEQLGYRAPDSGACAFICIGPVCLPPVSSVQALEAAVHRARGL